MDPSDWEALPLMNLTVGDPYLCSQNSNQDCFCDGTIIYGISAPEAMTLEEASTRVSKYASVKKLSNGEGVACSVAGMGSDPLPNEEKWCYCDPTVKTGEVLQLQPYYNNATDEYVIIVVTNDDRLFYCDYVPQEGETVSGAVGPSEDIITGAGLVGVYCFELDPETVGGGTPLPTDDFGDLPWDDDSNNVTSPCSAEEPDYACYPEDGYPACCAEETCDLVQADFPCDAPVVGGPCTATPNYQCYTAGFPACCADETCDPEQAEPCDVPGCGGMCAEGTLCVNGLCTAECPASNACCSVTECDNSAYTRCVGLFDDWCNLSWDEQCRSEAIESCGLVC